MYLYEFVLIFVSLAATILWALGIGRIGPNYPSIPFCIMVASFVAIIVSVGINGGMIHRCPSAGSGLQKVPGVYC